MSEEGEEREDSEDNIVKERKEAGRERRGMSERTRQVRLGELRAGGCPLPKSSRAKNWPAGKTLS